MTGDGTTPADGGRWLHALAAELDGRRVPVRERRRILLELQDHIACEPECVERLGDPGGLASSFADELAGDTARSSALRTFAALALAAVALVASQLALARYPGYRTGLSPAVSLPASIAMVVASQVALVAGSLGALRALRRRRVRRLPAAEIALIRARTRVALGAGIVTMTALELYAVNVAGVVPGWWTAMTATLAGGGGAGLIVAWRGAVRAGHIRCETGGPAGDIYDDLPIPGGDWLRRRPWRLGILVSAGAGLGVAALTGHAEHSVLEGLQRGVPEALAAAAGFAVLGRPIGARPTVMAQPAGVAAPSAARLRIGDSDRAGAEADLRDAFAAGRLGVDELAERVAAVHRASTRGDLDAVLRDLPG